MLPTGTGKTAPSHDDSGYFDFFDDGGYTKENQDILDNANNILGHVSDSEIPGRPCLRTKDSNDSMRSHISRGSSQFWEGIAAPDDDMLLAVDKTVLFHEKLQDSEVQNDCPETPTVRSNMESLNGTGPLEISTSCKSNETDWHGKRRLNHSDEPQDEEPQSKRQRQAGSLLFIDTDEKYDSTFVIPSLVQKKPDTSSTCHHAPSVAPDVTLAAHSDRHQMYFDKYKLPWGIQWEIARLVSCQKIHYDDIPINCLSQLAGKSNDEGAPLVEKLLCGQENDAHRRTRRQLYDEAFARELSTRTPWSELDKEDEYLARDPLSGLGSTNLQDNWYGGKVSFVAKLRQKEHHKKSSGYKVTPQYSLELEPPELGPSSRITRRWGSRRFLRVRIPMVLMRQPDNGILEYFSRPIVINSKVFRPFYAKAESGLFLIEVDQIYRDDRLMPDPNPAKLSLDKFLEWHNPMHVNKNQTLAKWCARMALGLSNSVPGIEFAAEDVLEIDDIYTPTGQAAIASGCKPDPKDIATDGCGFTNQKTLVDAKHRYNWDLLPSAIQFRHGGSKGLLLRHPDDIGSLDDPPKIWTRPSQKKISYTPGVPLDRAHLVLDILRRSRLKYPARLSTQIIVNLAENGVAYDVFESLMIDGLEFIVSSLTQWSGPYAMQNLWAAVANQGGVIRSRMAREAAGSSRALGLSSRDKQEGDDDDEEEECIDIAAHSKAWWADEISGCPSTLEETVLILLDAGFEPQSCHILAAKLKEVFKKALNRYIEDYRIEVPRSAEAWIVPDPCGVLESGEIFLRTSQKILGQDGLMAEHLLGNVLVTRHPCCVPSDVQKVRAVWKDELRGYYDVIIFSVKGERSLASMLGGGDYDGDTAHIIWDPTVVAAFSSADEKFADPPPGLDDAFEKDTVTVGDFLEIHHTSYEVMVLERQSYLLAALKNAFLVGSYSNWHDTAVYKFGYASDEAWRLAYMFCAVLDSSKTGKTVKSQILRCDRSMYNGPGPEWKESLLDENNGSIPHFNQGVAPRREGQLMRIKFIMDQLKATARKQYHHHMSCFEKLLEESRQKFKAQNSIKTPYLYVDPVLEAPWINAQKRAEKLAETDNQRRMKEELDVIRAHVEAVGERYRELLRPETSGRRGSLLSPRKSGSTFTEKPIKQRQNILRELSLMFSDMSDIEFLTLSEEDVRRYKASYAYILETERHEKRDANFARFPFDMAMRELGIIKAASLGRCNMMVQRTHVSRLFRGSSGKRDTTYGALAEVGGVIQLQR